MRNILTTTRLPQSTPSSASLGPSQEKLDDVMRDLSDCAVAYDVTANDMRHDAQYDLSAVVAVYQLGEKFRRLHNTLQSVQGQIRLIQYVLAESEKSELHS